MDDIYIHDETLPNGWRVSIVHLTFGRARILISKTEWKETVDDSW
jgi:hypothetical protein